MLRKGQAAMEFLMTYGWAILVVLIAIGALAYFGVLNPSRFLPESCAIGPGFSCDEFKVSADGSWTIIVRNGGGNDISAVDLDLSNRNPTGGTGAGSCNPTAVPAGSTTTCTGIAGSFIAGNAGNKLSANIDFDYADATLTHTKTGKLTSRYE